LEAARRELGIRVFDKGGAAGGRWRRLYWAEATVWRAGPGLPVRSARARGRARVRFGERTGMTAGPHKSAAVGGRTRERSNWAGTAAGLRPARLRLSQAERDAKRARPRNGRGFAGLPRRGPERKLARMVGTQRRIKEKSFIFSKPLQTIEFKCKFEFKHFKTMHQNVCNIKLLYFII
jgi:hypothetical protein